MPFMPDLFPCMLFTLLSIPVAQQISTETSMTRHKNILTLSRDYLLVLSFLSLLIFLTILILEIICLY